MTEGHEHRAKYCRFCGTWLNEETPDPQAPKNEESDNKQPENGNERDGSDRSN